MSINSSDLKMYLTGLAFDGSNSDGGSEQNDPNLSLGGLRSSTEVNPSTVLSADINETDTLIEVNDLSQMQSASNINPAFAIINEEIISYTAKSSNTGSGQLLNVVRARFNRIASSHSTNDVISNVSSQNLFDHVKATENQNGDTEYRCVAIRNTNSSETAYNVKVHLSPIKWENNATSSTSNTLIDSSITNKFSDDFFNNGTLTILSGTGLSSTPSNNIYTISDYDDSLGEFTISGTWNDTNPDSTTEFIVESKKASINSNNEISFAIERHKYSTLNGAGVATDGGVDFITDSDLISTAAFTDPDDFVGSYLLLLSGIGVDGVPKKIISYDNTIGKITVDQNFLNTGASMGDTYTIVRGPTDIMLPNEGVSPAFGTGFISNLSNSTSIDTALSIDVNNAGENLIHDELFFVWIERKVNSNNESFTNENIIPIVSFES